MPFVPRVVLSGLPHPVILRGINGQDVFLGGNDRRAYIDIFVAGVERHWLTDVGSG